MTDLHARTGRSVSDAVDPTRTRGSDSSYNSQFDRSGTVAENMNGPPSLPNLHRLAFSLSIG